MKKALTTLLIIFATGAYALPGSGIIPEDRLIDWSQSGIPGGIPQRTTICTTIDAAAYGNGQTDARAAIQSALDNCPENQVVYLPVGTYRITGSIEIPSNVTLRGSGMGTILKAAGSGDQLLSFGQGSWPSSSSSKSITAGAARSSNTITLSSASGITKGSYLMITELNDPNLVTILGNEGSCTWCDGLWDGKRTRGQIVEVTGVVGNQVSISPGLYIDYTRTPLATPFAAGAKYAGLEDLKISMYDTGYTTNVRMDGSAYCWIENIESDYADGDHVQALYAYRGEIRDSYFHDAFSHSPGQTDADVFIALKTSGFLIENNILRRLHAAIMLNWGAAGNVIGYNLMEGAFDDRVDYVLMGDMSMHGSHPQYNLMEGNVMASLHPDGTWGSSSHNVAFRNWMKGTTEICEPINGRGAETDDCWWAIQANRAVCLDFASLYYSLVGNVVGSQEMLDLTKYNDGVNQMGQESINVWPAEREYDSVAYSYSFGYGGSGENHCGDNTCSDRAYTTAIIHGDYDYVTGQVRWNSSDHEIPASLYLSSKPSWFGSSRWPPIGPEVTGYASKIPAQLRYESILSGSTCLAQQGICCTKSCDGTVVGATDCACCVGSCGDNPCGNGACDNGESCSTCSQDCRKNSGADGNPCNGCVETTELNSFIYSWMQGSVTMQDLIASITAWKGGCR
jgi:hypothetical protein